MQYRICKHKELIPEQCHYCWLAINNPRYKKWANSLPDGIEPVIPATIKEVKKLKQQLNCIYFGDRLGGSSCGGWLHRCNYDGVVCSKTNCKDAERVCLKCDYATPIESLQLGQRKLQLPILPKQRPILVPTPPPLQLKPTCKQALVTVVTGETIGELFTISRPLMEAYAKRHGLDFVVLDWAGSSEWPMAAKFAIPRALEWYDRFLYVDADVLLRPKVPNFMEIVEPSKMAFWDDLPDVIVKGDGFVNEFLRFRELVSKSNKPPFRLEHYWNTGVFIASQEHIPYFTVPTLPIPPWHCSEQHWWVSQFIEQNAPIQAMPREFNWQWWADPEFRVRSVPDEAVLHFSGWTEGNESRVKAMQQWAV